jgi:hypothetical protein
MADLISDLERNDNSKVTKGDLLWVTFLKQFQLPVGQ